MVGRRKLECQLLELGGESDTGRAESLFHCSQEEGQRGSCG
jgi:hypothetical protein